MPESLIVSEPVQGEVLCVAWEGIPAYDEAAIGELCAVPCLPTDGHGDDLDCPTGEYLAGVIGADGQFRSEDAPKFNPKRETWECGRCRIAIARGWRAAS